MHITIVLGSARKGRRSEHVARALEKCLRIHKAVDVAYVDVRDHVRLPETIPPWGVGGANEVSTIWKDTVQKTDVILFVLPEYNHGYPGEWKLLVDSLSKEYTGKKAYIVGVSSGSFSGVRVADHVKPVLIELNFTVQKKGLYVGSLETVFDEGGVLIDDTVRERMSSFVDDVVKGA